MSASGPAADSGVVANVPEPSAAKAEATGEKDAAAGVSSGDASASQPAGGDGTSGKGGESTAQTAANPLDELGSMFSGWMSAASTVASAAAASVAEVAQKADGDAVRSSTAGDRSVGAEKTSESAGGMAETPSGAPDPNKWLSDAGKLWETAVKDVGERLEAAKLDEKVNEIRESSTHFVADVTKNIQENLDGIDGDVLRQRAGILEASTKQFLATASEQFQSRTKEAIDIFVDKDVQKQVSADDVCAPWDPKALPESERKHADALREEMLKIVVDCIYSKKRRTSLFLSGAAAAASFTFNAEANAPQALAVLEADQNMRRLRSGLVPQKITEDVFWNEYFFNVQRVRNSLVANGGVMPDEEPSIGDDDDAALFGDDDDGEDEEIAALHSPVRPPARTSLSSTGGKTNVETESGHAADGSAAESKKVSAGADGKSGDENRDWENEIDALFGDEKDV